MGAEAAILDFLSRTVGRFALVSFRTEGALTCRVNVVGTAAEPFVDSVVSLGWITFVVEFALSALRRAGFFRGFFVAVSEAWSLAAGTAVCVATAMSIYLRASGFLRQESVRPVPRTRPWQSVCWTLCTRRENGRCPRWMLHWKTYTFQYATSVHPCSLIPKYVVARPCDE